MTKKKVFIACFTMAIIITIAYVINFKGFNISKSPSDWSDFSSYISGLLTPFLTFINILVLVGVKNTIDNISGEHKRHTQRLIEFNKNKSNEYKLHINPNATIEDNLNSLEMHLESIQVFFDTFRTSDINCIKDLYDLAEKANLDKKSIQNIKNIPYKENPFSCRNWESHNLGVRNTMSDAYKELYQLKVNLYKLICEINPEDKKNVQKHRNAIENLEKYLKEAHIAD